MTEHIENTVQKINVEPSREGKYLTFTLGDEEYGIRIIKVREIIGIINITKIPNMPRYVKGVINLRGKVSPVIDLRAKFSMEAADYDPRTCIILVEINTGTTATLMGMIVDSVSEVMHLTDNTIEEPPEISEATTDFILGIAKKAEKIIILLDIDKVMTFDEVSAMDNAA